MVNRGTSSKPRIAIVGAGVAGLTCAARLIAAGCQPIVFEKSRGLGGRLATRRVGDDFSFDHGAQFVTARSSEFRRFLQAAVGSGAARQWRPNGYDTKNSESGDWVVGVPTMNAFMKPVAAVIDIRLDTQVLAIYRQGAGWYVGQSSARNKEKFDAVVVAVPAPQARDLIVSEPATANELARVSIAPCWALMLVFETPFDPGFDAQKSYSDDLAWIARNGSKPGRNSAKDCWVVHASPSWSERHLELDREAAAVKMIELVQGASADRIPEIVYASAHRWRYALTTKPLGRPFLASSDNTLFIGGDWCLGARVEYAFESGYKTGEAIIDTIAI